MNHLQVNIKTMPVSPHRYIQAPWSTTRRSLRWFLLAIVVALSLGSPAWAVHAQRVDAHSPVASVPTSSAGTLATTPGWFATGEMGQGRELHAAALLADGRVLVSGGDNGSFIRKSSEVYDPATGLWKASGDMANARHDHTMTTLPNGRVLIAGGKDENGPLMTAELYDPQTGTWGPTGDMTSKRLGHTATLLLNGQVLVAGGERADGILSTAELYDPATGKWSAIEAMITARQWHSATLLPNGKVLVAGGDVSAEAFQSIADVEIYDPVTGKWTATQPMDHVRGAHSATLLPNGLVLVAGGYAAFPAGSEEVDFVVDGSELFDPETGTWSPTASLNAARNDHSATLLPSGQVLVIGGGTGDDNPAAGELYNPELGVWTATTTGVLPQRLVHTATLLPSGQVLVAGGIQTGSGALLASAGLYEPATAKWDPTGSLFTTRYGQSATLLSDGRVLVAGGDDTDGERAGAEIFDPATGTWSETGSMGQARAYHTATLLPNGKVLVAGGYTEAGKWRRSVELYDPATGTWAAEDSMNMARSDHSATLLADGRVLVVGGEGTSDFLGSAEIYDPTTGKWNITGTMAKKRGFHRATLLPDNEVLVSGGYNGTARLADAERYDPASGTWSDASDMGAPRSDHSASLLPNGQVLIAGGGNENEYPANAELYDPTSNTWDTTDQLATPRRNHSATLLDSGQLLIVGGESASGYLADAELFDPATRSWRSAGSMGVARALLRATLLLNGQVLVSGGRAAGNTGVSNADLYDHGRGFEAAWRPVVNSVTPALSTGETVTANGAGWRGVGNTEAATGATNSSAANYPLVQLYRLEGGQTIWLPTATSTATELSTLALPDFPLGHARATVFLNGIPSQARVIRIAKTYTITPSAGPSGSIAPDSAQDVYGDDDLTFTITPATGYHIADVQVDGVSVGAVDSHTFNSISADHTISATFAIDTYSLKVAKAGTGSGSVSSIPAGIECGDECSGAYDAGTAVTLAATADMGSTFVGWAGDCNTDGQVTVSRNSSCTATFVRTTASVFTLTVNKTGSGSGSVTSDPAGIDCGSDCSEEYAPGTAITLSANADAGSAFDGWSGACDAAGRVIMDAAKGCIATFTFEATADGVTVFLPLISR